MRLKLAIERLRERFWILPGLAIVIALVAGNLLPPLDREISLPEPLAFGGGPDTSLAVLQMIATVAITVAGISFSVIAVALVLASQQLSPRVLRSFQRHPLNQFVIALFLGTAAFTLFVLGSVRADEVPELSISIAMALSAVSLVAFVVFLHHLVRSLNASALIRRLAAEGHRAIDEPYPRPVHGEPPDEEQAEAQARAVTESVEPVPVKAPRAGYLASVRADSLIRAASEDDAFVEQRVAIGNFVLTGETLAFVRSRGDAESLCERVSRDFILNEERIVDDDVAFPIRQLADIALKGLSPSINDPTTAENAMDSVTDTLVRLGREGPRTALCVDHQGKPRLRATSPSFDDLVRLGFDQARRDGARRPSFAVRLLELLAGLRDLGGSLARESAEIPRQARALGEHATAAAEIDADRNLIRSAYERLHDDSAAADGHLPIRASAPRV